MAVREVGVTDAGGLGLAESSPIPVPGRDLWGGNLPSLLGAPPVPEPFSHPAPRGRWQGLAEKGQSWPAPSPCSTEPAWSHPAGWPESCSHCGLLGTEQSGQPGRVGRGPAQPAPRQACPPRNHCLPDVTLLSVSWSRGTCELWPPTAGDWPSVAVHLPSRLLPSPSPHPGSACFTRASPELFLSKSAGYPL